MGRPRRVRHPAQLAVRRRDDPLELEPTRLVERLGTMVGEDPLDDLAGSDGRRQRRPVGRRPPGERREGHRAEAVAGARLDQEVAARADRPDDVEGERRAARIESGEIAADPLVEVGVEHQLLGDEEGAGLEEPHPAAGLGPEQGAQRQRRSRLRRGLPVRGPGVGAEDAGEGRHAPGVGQLDADRVHRVAAEARREEVAGPRVHDAGHERVEDRGARMLELDQRERGDDLGIALGDRAGDRCGPGRAGGRHRHEADRQPGRGEDEGALHPLGVLGERRDRADERRQRRAGPQGRLVAGEHAGHLDRVAGHRLAHDRLGLDVLDRVRDRGQELVERRGRRVVAGAHDRPVEADRRQGVGDPGHRRDVAGQRRAPLAGRRVDRLDPAAVGRDVQRRPVEDRVVGRRPGAHRVAARRGGHRPLDEIGRQPDDRAGLVDPGAVGGIALADPARGAADADTVEDLERRGAEVGQLTIVEQPEPGRGADRGERGRRRDAGRAHPRSRSAAARMRVSSACWAGSRGAGWWLARIQATRSRATSTGSR